MTNVLVVDDDELFAETLCEYLEDSGGIKIIQRCASYSEAKKFYSNGHLQDIDAVILDLILPYGGETVPGGAHTEHHMNTGDQHHKNNGSERLGLTILDELRRLYSFKGPVVMLTNSRESMFGREALSSGCSGYLCKHASADAIPQMVAELRLALTGQVVLISSALNHLIIGENQVQTLLRDDEKTATNGQLMNLLLQNPVWPNIQKGLGYGAHGEDTIYNRIVREFHGPNENSTSTSVNLSQSGTFAVQPSAPEGAGLVRTLLESAPRAIFITTTNGIIVFSNQASMKLFGGEKDSFLGQNIKEIFPELKDSCGNHDTVEKEFYAIGHDGCHFPVSVASNTLQESNCSYCVHIFTDLTSQKITEQKLKAMVSKLEESSTRLEQMVKTDPLTGLLNRRGLENILTREIALARRNRSDLLALLIDLDDFKSVNDQHGHAAGDTVLKGVATVLKDTLRTSDWLGRIGGDEFMIFLPSTSLDNGAMIAERIRAAVENAHMGRNGSELRITTSIGVVRLPYEVTSLEEVLELTKSGLKASKGSGKNVVSISNDSSPGSSAALLSSRDLLLRRNEFSVAHQPIYHLHNGRPVAIELFSRGPDGELNMPTDFFFVARVNHMLTEVDMNCLTMCLAHGESFPEHLIIHINVLPSTLAELPTERILAMTHSLRTSRRLCLELSEKHLMSDPSYLLPKIRILKEAGILLALDDVGFGCSSLETLTLFEPDCIKIDHNVVCGLSNDQRKAQTVARLIQIAQSLNTVPIAEGIETIEDLTELKDMGVTHGQGWLWQNGILH